VIVFEETDERFFAGVWLTRSERFVVISTSSKLTSEEWLLDASDPTAEPRVVAPRRQGVEYSIDHQAGPAGADRLLILHNDGAENFEIATATLDDPAAWTPLVPHRPDTRLMDISAFRDHLMVYYRRDGLSGLRVMRADGSEYEVAFGEPVYAVTPGANAEYDSRLFRLGFVSLVTPDSVYDLDTVTGDLSLLRRRPVLELPGRGAYRPEDYEQHREWRRRQRTAPRSRSPSSAGKTRAETAQRPSCFMATAVTNTPPTLRFPSRGCLCSIGASVCNRPHPRRRRDGQALVRRRQAAQQDQHLH
jgi:oligopeptidase B